MDAFDALLRETLLVAAVIALPVLAAGAGVGTLVAVIQAATQIQEQTLTLLPKVIVVGLLAACCGGFAMHLCAQLFADALAAIPALASGT